MIDRQTDRQTVPRTEMINQYHALHSYVILTRDQKKTNIKLSQEWLLDVQLFLYVDRQPSDGPGRELSRRGPSW